MTTPSLCWFTSLLWLPAKVKLSGHTLSYLTFLQSVQGCRITVLASFSRSVTLRAFIIFSHCSSNSHDSHASKLISVLTSSYISMLWHKNEADCCQSWPLYRLQSLPSSPAPLNHHENAHCHRGSTVWVRSEIPVRLLLWFLS